MFGATRKTQEISAMPTVRISESITPARSPLRVPPPDEQEQPRDEGRIDGQVDGVAERRELDVGAEELRVAVGVEVAGEEEELADDEEQPGGARPRPVQVDPDGDRDRRGEAEEVDQRAVPLQRREPQVARR